MASPVSTLSLSSTPAKAFGAALISFSFERTFTCCKTTLALTPYHIQPVNALRVSVHVQSSPAASFHLSPIAHPALDNFEKRAYHLLKFLDGDGLPYPIREDAPLGGASVYGRRKAECERQLMAAHTRGDLPITIIRPAHTYGEGGGFIYSLGRGPGYLDRIRKGKPIVVHGDGSSLWATAHIDDVGHAFVQAVANPKTLGRGYHVTGEEPMTWIAIIKAWLRQSALQNRRLFTSRLIC